MKTSKKEAQIVSLTFLVFMTLIFLCAVVTRNMLDVLYVGLIIFFLSRLIYIKLLGDEEEEETLF